MIVNRSVAAPSKPFHQKAGIACPACRHKETGTTNVVPVLGIILVSFDVAIQRVDPRGQLGDQDLLLGVLRGQRLNGGQRHT